MPKKRNKKNGRFEHQYKKTMIVVSQVVTYLRELNWQKRLRFFLSPVESVSQIALDLESNFKHLEDIDAF